MYKIVNITDLNVANTYISSDQIVEISSDQSKMYIADNDYAHKSQSYLSTCITNADSSLNTYLSALDNLKTTYFTSDITDVYITNGNLIDNSIIDRILSSDAFLTKEGCKEIESRCIAYLNEIKNKAVSIIMAQLNESFIAQQSVGKPAYGQKTNEDDGLQVSYISDILQFQNTGLPGTNEVSSNNYNFETGEFSLASLLFNKIDFGTTTSGDITIGGMPDVFIDNYLDNVNTFARDTFFYSTQDAIDFVKNYLLFNAADNENQDFKISVPKASFDFQKNQTIPIGPMIETVLKNQIKTVIKNVCDHYISKMTSVPTLTEI